MNKYFKKNMIMKSTRILALLAAVCCTQAAIAQSCCTTPSFTKNIVMYELATKSFTSPNGPESGTFNSAAEKIPYLKDLGINTIWLTGNNWADNNHFYGIWTQYAVIRPDSIEPTLGTPADFKALIDLAHKYEIKVFLDVITHGVMSYSPLVKEHPEWFKGGTWGMTDFDWKGGHKDLDEWWVKTWTDYVFKYGVDGFRLDVSIYRPDLWRRIKEICAERGKSIVVLDESTEPFEPGAVDFYQHYARFMDHKDPDIDTSSLFIKNVAKYFNRDYSTNPFYYSIQLSCHDNGWVGYPAGINPYVAKGSRFLFGYATLFTPAIPVFMSGEEWNADFKPLPRLSPDLFSKTPPSDSSRWLYGSWLQWDQLEQPSKKAMWKDVQKMLSIRKSESDVIHAITPGTRNKNILPVSGNFDKGIPVPYLMWNDSKAILIAGNNNIDGDLQMTLKIPIEETGMTGNNFKVTDLWNDANPTVLSNKELHSFRIKIKRDKQPKGGVAVYKIEKL